MFLIQGEKLVLFLYFFLSFFLTKTLTNKKNGKKQQHYSHTLEKKKVKEKK